MNANLTRWLILLLLGILPLACKTPAPGRGTGSSLYDGGAPAEVTAKMAESPSEQCSKFGGEIIDNECICADGTPKSKISGVDHCSAWVKKKYPDCYAKGGMPKTFGENGQQICVCPHGEALPKGASSCYDVFKEKYPDCAAKGGIVLADESVCKCLHGASALKLRGSCEDDFTKENELCAKKLGVTNEGSACRCRDGNIVDANENVVCAEPWFFYKKETVTAAIAAASANAGKNPGASAASKDPGSSATSASPSKDGGQDASAMSKTDGAASTASSASQQTRDAATCACTHYVEHCVMYKPGDKKAIKWVKTTAENCTKNFCYKNFSDVIFKDVSNEDGAGGCGGSWDYKAAVSSGEAPNAQASSNAPSQDIGKYCICTKLRSSSPQGCGLFLPGKSQPNSYANTMTTCTPENCVSLFGNSYTLKTHCYDADSKKYLWRHQD